MPQVDHSEAPNTETTLAVIPAAVPQSRNLVEAEPLPMMVRRPMNRESPLMGAGLASLYAPRQNHAVGDIPLVPTSGSVIGGGVSAFLQSSAPFNPLQPPVHSVANGASGAAAQVVHEGQLYVRAPVAEQESGVGRFGAPSPPASFRLDQGGTGCMPGASRSGHGTSSSSTALVPLPPPRHLGTVPATESVDSAYVDAARNGAFWRRQSKRYFASVSGNAEWREGND